MTHQQRNTFLSIVGLICLVPALALAQDFMMQGFYWDYPGTPDGKNWADTLENKAAHLADAGFTYIWLPPLSRSSSGSYSMGYNPRDLYDLGEYGGGATRFGTRADVDALIAEFDSQGLKAVADMIYNHRDGGAGEDNGAVEGWIENLTWAKVNAGDNAYPSDRFRCYLVLGPAHNFGVGTYYFKISSASGHSNYYNKPYTLYMQTNTVGWKGLADLNESEPNGGGDCSQPFNAIELGRDMNAATDASGCMTDEFGLTISSGDFNSAGDTLWIYMANVNGNYSDHRIYGLWYDDLDNNPPDGDIQSYIRYQTYTDFTNMPSGQGAMTYMNFKPNGNPTQLSGDWDWPWFYYDYDQSVTSTQTALQDFTRWMWNGIGARGFRLDAVKHFDYAFTGNLLDHLHDNGIDPGMVVGEYFDGNPSALKAWIDNVYANMDTDTKQAILPRAFDFALRWALKGACDQYGYDVRNLFNSGMVDGAGAGGYNVVTFTDNHDFRSGGDNPPINNDPILPYAYILTNNQIGLPCVYYYDYYNRGLGGRIDALIAVHRQFIYGAPSRDYLSRFSTPYHQGFSSGYASTTLFYQLSGVPGDRDVLVAVNFAGEPLTVTHGVNMSTMNLSNGDTLTDVLGYAAAQSMIVDGSGRVQFSIPSRSYTVWVKGGPDQFLHAAAGPDVAICLGESIEIGGSPTVSGGVLGGPFTITWSPNNGSLSDIHSANPMATPSATTTYTVTVTEDPNGLTVTDQVTVTVNPVPTVTFNPAGPFLISDPPQDFFGLVSPSGGTFSGAGMTGSQFNPASAGPGTHVIWYKFTNEFNCTDSSSQGVTVTAPDRDNDGVPDVSDNCPDIANSSQKNSDSDSHGDACDNCPYKKNEDQADSDEDGVGDVCDMCLGDDATGDSDGDGVCDDLDQCLGNDATGDDDGDGICQNRDNCPAVSNPDQADRDSDGVGDACDVCPDDPANDPDRDGICGSVDNCPCMYNPDQADVDGDGVGDICLNFRGDVDKNCTVNILDVVRVINIILELHSPTAYELEAGDCNGDGALNIIDALGIVNVILDLGECAS